MLPTPRDARPPALRVAQVGFVGAANDLARWAAVRDWLRANDPVLAALLDRQVARGDLQWDAIDLNGEPPRDFLAETARYDVVVTHDLWGGDNATAVTAGGTAQSPHHGRRAWRDRLAATEARYIFLAGTALNLAYLGGDVCGYDAIDFLGPWFINILRRTDEVGPVRPETAEQPPLGPVPDEPPFPPP